MHGYVINLRKIIKLWSNGQVLNIIMCSVIINIEVSSSVAGSAWFKIRITRLVNKFSKEKLLSLLFHDLK